MSGVEPIAIIGIGCRLPGGVRSSGDLWKLLVGGVDAITEVPNERWYPAVYHPDPGKPGRMNSRWGGFLDQIDRFDAEFFGISPREAALADPQQRLMLEVAYEAAEDAGLTLPALANKRASVYVGISTFDYGAMQFDSQDRSAIDAYTSLGAALSIAANRISYFFNLVGPSLAVDTACSSSLVATDLACRSIWNDDCELAFAAGVNLMLRPEVTIGHSKAAMLSPDGRCKSFDSRANGFVRGEGIGLVILKPLARAMADRDQIYAIIRATAVNQDGHTDGISVPSRASQAANLRAALRLADIAPETVQYVEAHGTGTPVGDPIEAAALGEVYGTERMPGDSCVIGSIKSNIGHLEAAAGITGLIKAALCLRHRQIPPTLHFEKPNPRIPFDDLRLRVAQRLESWPETHGHPARAGVNSFGFGGTNAHAILEAPPDAVAVAGDQSANGCACMLPLSARSSPALSDLARSYVSALRDEHALMHPALRDICHSASMRRSHHEFRLALVAHDKAELVERLDAFLQGEARADSASGRASGERLRPVFVCSGMGQQWWAMGRELLSQEPVYRRTIEVLSDLYARLSGWSLLEKLTADEKDSQIQETHIGQPAIFALQVGLAALWRSWGVEPTAVLGHSAGEMAAAYISGALSLEDAVQVAFHRSRLQHRAAGQGTMLAAAISRAEAARLVERHPQAISIAAINGPRSITLAGESAVLAEIDASLNDAGLFSRILDVEVPYHSPKMEQLETELVDCLRHIQPRPASIPLFSTVTGAALAGPEMDARYWYRNIRQPVLFQDTIGAIVGAGHRLFLEIGAHPVLRRDIAECLREKGLDGAPLSSLRRGDRDGAALLGSLGRLYTLGAQIEWPKLYPRGVTAIKLPPYPFQAESHWRESDRARRVRLSRLIHPLLGSPLEAVQPSWKGELDPGDLGYLADHRIGGSIVFPGAGYVEMALAAARETFGPGPCILEDIELQKLLVLDEKAPRPVQVSLDAASGDFQVYARLDASGNSWEPHARGRVTRDSRPALAAVDLMDIRQRCLDPFDADEHYQLLAAMDVTYGPTFRGVVRLWRGERQALIEICVPGSLDLSDYCLHPAVLDTAIQSVSAALPPTFRQAGRSETYVPVMIERVRIHAATPARLFAYARLTKLGNGELKANVQLVDEAGNRLVDVQGITCRPTGRHRQKARGILYEHQWILAPRRAIHGARPSDYLPSPDALTAILQQEARILRERLNRARFQNEFKSRARMIAAAYIVRALRELGWREAACTGRPTADVANQLGVIPQYHQFLQLFLTEFTPDELASTHDPRRLWKTLWSDFPECHAETTLLRHCGEALPSVLRGDVDPLHLFFSEALLPVMEHLYQDSQTVRVSNLLVQKAIAEITHRLPKGKSLRILEIGGGTGGMTHSVLPVLPEHCTEYVFTDVSPHFIVQAQHKFARYPFVQYRPLDIESDPVEQGFDSHSFDLIIASDVLHATQDLRKTLDRVKQLLGLDGTLVLREITRPWLSSKLIFGMLKGWWLFKDHDLRPAEPCLPPGKWKALLHEAGFGATVCIGDTADLEQAQHAVILARGPDLPVSSLTPQASSEPQAWLLFADVGAANRPSVGRELALQLRERGDGVIEVTHGEGFRRFDPTHFQIRAGEPDDMRNLMGAVSKQARGVAGILHLWSLDSQTTEAMAGDDLVASARLGSIGALQLIQALAVMDGFAVGGIWLVTRLAQAIYSRAGRLEVAQSPMWGFGRVAATEYRNLTFRLVDMATCCHDEISSLVEELSPRDDSEDEIAFYGALRYVNRLIPVAPTTIHGMGRETADAAKPFRVEVRQQGLLDSLSPKSLRRRRPKPTEVEIEIFAAGLNFKDLMLAMGMLPNEAIAPDQITEGLGFECAGRVVAVGNEAARLAVGDEVVATGAGTLASHITVDQRFAVRKPSRLAFEGAATIPVAFATAHYSLHTLGRVQRGERVLIHSATGGVGLAAVQLALQAGAIVFATAGSPEKRALLSALGVPHVMDSRSLAFADDVLKSTDGEGVDLVLNSLTGEAIDKSLSILRSNGRFIEIGKIDIYKNRKLGMRLLRKNISLFAVDLDGAFAKQPELAHSLLDQVLSGFEGNDLRPLPHRVYPVGRVGDALRHMAQAKHIGKLIVDMKDRQGLKIEREPQSVTIDPDANYLITGGFGGLGLAVAHRLARHGARHLALVGRSDPTPSALVAVASLRQSGVEVMTYRADVADPAQAQQVIAAVRRISCPLRGVVHAAMVLDDAPIEVLTEERMWKAMGPKIMGAWNLHTLTAGAPLDFFVLFSSFSSMTGNPGQANYCAGNAFLDSLAYYRRSRSLCALTLNWGMVGEVGHVANSPKTSDRFDRIGVSAIPVADTLDVLDELLSSNAVQIGVAQVRWKDYLRSTGSRVPARLGGLAGETAAEQDRSTGSESLHEIFEADETARAALLVTYLREKVARTIGASPARIDTEQYLANLGLDSLMHVEIRNRIKADLGINIPMAKFSQGTSVSALAAFVAERLREDGRTERSKGAAARAVASAESSSPPREMDVTGLLERIDQLSDDEVDRQLRLLEMAPNPDGRA